MNKNISRLFRFSLAVSILFLIGLAYLFTDSYYLRSLRIVNNASDPRWRVFDFNSRQATEGEIYNVAKVPVISKVKEVSRRKLRFWFSPPIKTTSWKVVDVETGIIMGQGNRPEIQFTDHAYNGTLRFIPEGVTLLKELKIPFSLKKPYSIDEWVGFSGIDKKILKEKQEAFINT